MNKADKTLKDITEARTHYKGYVIIWHNHSIAGHINDKRYWLAEKNGEVIDYHLKRFLIRDAVKNGENVVVLTIHKNNQVSAKVVTQS